MRMYVYIWISRLPLHVTNYISKVTKHATETAISYSIFTHSMKPRTAFSSSTQIRHSNANLSHKNHLKRLPLLVEESAWSPHTLILHFIFSYLELALHICQGLLQSPRLLPCKWSAPGRSKPRSPTEGMVFRLPCGPF